MVFFVACLSGAGCKKDEPGGNGNSEPSLAPEEIDAACALIVSCLPPASESASDCSTSALTRPAAGRRFTQAWLECLAAAGSRCDAVNTCAPEVVGDPCADMPQGETCQGDRLISCFGGRIDYVTDCAAWGLECAEVAGESQCRGTGPSCLEGSESCDGTTAVMCLGYSEERFDCSELVDGRRCVERSDMAFCVSEVADCDPTTFIDACDGAAVVFCSASGREVRLDCTLLGFTGCIQEGDRAICGEVAGSGG